MSQRNQDNNGNNNNGNNNSNNSNSDNNGNNNKFISTEEIQFIPHFTTLTDGGKSHFNRIADGLAEFVDNSMEACKKANVENSEISIDFFIEKSNKGYNGFCIIADNGIGMDKDGLKDFATFSLDQNTKRQNTNDESLGKFISKYGVGAKQAGFYLGNRVRIVSKPLNKNVFELTLDREEFEDRYQKQQIAFTAPINTRLRNDLSHLPEEEKKWPKLVEIMTGHETKNAFTYIVIKLEQEIVKCLLKGERYKFLKSEMAEIYHFHLHPEHRPNNIIETFRDKTLDGFPSQQKLRESVVDKFMVDMYLTVWSREGCLGHRIKLNEENENPVAKFIDKAQHAFRFNIMAPASVNKYSSTQDEDQNRLTIEGIIFYYPFDQGETRPDIRPLVPYDEDEMKGEVEKSIIPTFNAFWVNRLVPASEVKRLPFFPKKTSLKLVEMEIPKDWMNRVKGYLFFDRDFPITNNKLRIQIDPDIDTFLNDKKVEQSDKLHFYPRSINEDFKKWLKACHKTLDRESRFEERDYELERTKKCDTQNFVCFKKLNILGANKIIIQKDDIIKLNTHIAGKSQLIFAKVLTFETEKVDGNSDHDRSTAKIRYTRVPVSLFHEKEHDSLRDYPFAPIVCLDVKSKDGYKASEKDIQNVEKLGPQSLKITLFDTKGSNGQICNEKDGKNIQDIKTMQRVPAGKPIYKIGAQIVNGNKDCICLKPHSSSHNKYKVRLTINKDCGDNSTDFGTTNELWYYDEITKDEEKMDKNKNLKDSYYSFFGKASDKYDGIKLNRVGVNSLDFDVFDADDQRKVILSRTVFLYVESESVSGFSIGFSSPLKELRLGEGIPAFDITFKDKFQNVVNYVGKVMTKITCDNMEVFYKGKKENKIFQPRWELDPTDEGILPISDNLFQALPTTSNIFADSLDTIEKEFTLEIFEISPTSNDEMKKKISSPSNDEMKKIGECQFTLKYVPGIPHQLVLVDPCSLPIEVTSNESIDSITIAVLDAYGNRTAPQGKKNAWQLSIDGTSNFKIKAINANVLNSGEGTFRSISVNVDNNHADGIVGRAIVKLIGIKEKDINITLDIPLKIIPSIIPDVIKVYYRGDPLLDETVFTCNSVISDLSFKIFDSQGQEMEFSSDMFKDKGSYLNFSWVNDNENENVGKKSKRGSRQSSSSIKSCNLPDITLDSKIESQNRILDFSIGGVVYGEYEVNESFTIRVNPGPAKEWKIVTGSKFNDGIMSDDCNDLQSKVLCVCMIDEFENLVDADENLVPHLFVKSNDPTIDNEHEEGAMEQDSTDPELSLILRRPDENFTQTDRKNKNAVKLPNISCYVIDKNECLRYYPAPAPLWLYVCDEQRKIAPISEKCHVISGLPAILKLSCINHNIVVPQIQAAISTSMFTPSVQMFLHTLDRSSNEATIKSGIEVCINVLDADGEEKEIFSVKGLKQATQEIIVPISKALKNFDQNIDDLVLRFNGSYTHERETYNLEPSQLFCSIQKMNAVIEFKSYLFNNRERQNEASDLFEIHCSDPLPSIALEAITDDGNTYIPPLEDLEVNIRSNDDVSSNMTGKLSHNGRFCVLTLQSLSQLQVGLLNISIKYEEKRPNLTTLNLPGLQEIEKTLTLKVLADPPAVLKLDNNGEKKLSNIFVSQHQLLMASNVQFTLTDQYDNPCTFYNNMHVKCRIISDGDGTNLPKLQFATADGSIIAKIDKNRKTATFSKIEIVDLDTDETNLHLEFSVIADNSTPVAMIPALSYPFKLFSNEMAVEQVNNIRQKLKPFEDWVSNYEADMTKLKSEYTKANKSIDASIKAARMARLKELSNESISMKKVEELHADLEQQRRRFADNTQVRPAKKRETPRIEQLRDVPVIGMVVDLGFVDDLNNANILSWAASQYMKTVVVETYDSSKTLYERGVRSWAKDGIVPYQVPSKNGSRTEVQMKAGKLFGPLEGAKEMPGGIKGNPEYLAELVNLHDESLRDTVFYNIFKRTLLFDDLNSAIEYRKFMVSRKKTIPTIYTRTGEKLSQEGILDPIGGKMPQNLDYVFGQMKPQHGNDYKYIEQDIDICKKLLELMTTRNTVDEELSSLNAVKDDYENKKETIAGYQAELNSLSISNKKGRNSKRDRDVNVLVDDEILQKSNTNKETVSRVSNGNRKRLAADLENE